jgi:hypothetical protein
MSSGAMPTTPTIAQRGNSLGDFVAWRWGLLALWLAASALFLGRAIAGRFPQPLSSLGLIAVAIVMLMMTIELRALLRRSWSACATPPQSRTAWLAQLLPTFGAILLATGFSVGGAYPTGLVLLWVLVAAEVLFGAGGPWTLSRTRGWLVRDQAERGTVNNLPRGVIPEKTRAEPMAREAFSNEADEEACDEELPWLWQESAALQELRYITVPEQGLSVSGSQRVTLPATQQTAVVHTVFHPPFVNSPVVTIEMQEPELVKIKAAQILPHGIRWELRAEQSAEQPREVQWAFTAASRSLVL